MPHDNHEPGPGDVIERRADFSDFGGFAYLNCAYHGPMPRVSARAAQAAMRLKQNPQRIQDAYHFTFPDAYRAAVARLIGCTAADVALTDSTTHGMMTLVGGLDWKPGDEVVVPEGEFPANLFPWRSLEADGVVLKRVGLDPAADGGATAVQAVADALSPRTRVVSVSWVSYTTGLRNDIAAIGHLCRNRGIVFAVDGSQGIGGLPFDLAALPCDLLACSGYKWMLGPYGLGFAYVNPSLADRLRPFNVNWFAIHGARDFNRLSRARFEFEAHARKFDINEAANFINTAAGTAAVHYLLDVTPDAVSRHVKALQTHLVDNLPETFRVVHDVPERMRSNIMRISGPTEERTRAAFERALARKVVVSMREGAIRIAPHVYNTLEDVERFLEAVADRASPTTARGALRVGDEVAPAPADARDAARRTSGWVQHRPLHGTSCSLHPLDAERHVESLYEVSHGTAEREALWTYMPYGPFASVDEMKDWLVPCAASEDPLWFTVVHHGSDRGVGLVSFLNMEPMHRTLELGHIWYGTEFQRTGLNTESINLMLREAFDRLGCRRVEWKCDALNERSRAAAVRLGFTFEGVFRQHRIVKGRNRDTAWYAMLDSDWPEVQANLTAWMESETEARTSLTALNASVSSDDQAILERLGCIPSR